MMNVFRRRLASFRVWSSSFSLSGRLLALVLVLPFPGLAADSLTWRTNQNLVSADIKGGSLFQLLSQVASATGWKVFVEPGSTREISAKFKNLPPGDALHLLLGDLNFALVPATNASPKLFVFRTTLKNATQAIRPIKGTAAKLIPNELIVRLKPGAKIEELARSLGAKVLGRIDGLNAYRLQFEDQAAADSAREQLATNPEVASIENNFEINRPPDPQPFAGNAAPPQLHLNPPPSSGQVTIGLLDTALQPLGNGLDQFVLKGISVAGDFQPDPNAPTHGTTMIETILSTLQALGNGSSSVKIQPYDIYGPSETANTFNVANALELAINAGANPISQSFGGPDSQIVRDIILEGSKKGVRFYSAVGNDGGPQMDFPAGDPGATPVTAVDRNGNAAPYANQSGGSAVGALGTIIVSVNGQSWVVTGTSVSTAIASATASSLMEKGASAAQANSRLLNGPTPTTIPRK
ncbi:MAG: thermitase [Verrucomicrobiota bacterium]